jgi:hypothetical protein
MTQAHGPSTHKSIQPCFARARGSRNQETVNLQKHGRKYANLCIAILESIDGQDVNSISRY